jgi:NADH-quinone oxidoreductase subunit H
LLFRLAPLIALVPAFAAWAVVPFDAQVVLSNANAGLLYLLAMTSLGVYGIILAGWASNSKYAFLGAMRGAAQVVSYEIAMGFALVGVLIAAGSLNLSDIVMAQAGNGGFTVRMVLAAAVAAVRRVFHLRRGRNQPRAVRRGRRRVGNRRRPHGRVLRFAFALFFLAEYANMILVSFLTATFFLGGWLSPIPGPGSRMCRWSTVIGTGWWWLAGQGVLLRLCFIWFRATFPRYRYDQIMRLGWKVFIPITIVWIAVTALLVFSASFRRG